MNDILPGSRAVVIDPEHLLYKNEVTVASFNPTLGIPMPYSVTTDDGQLHTPLGRSQLEVTRAVSFEQLSERLNIVLAPAVNPVTPLNEQDTEDSAKTPLDELAEDVACIQSNHAQIQNDLERMLIKLDAAILSAKEGLDCLEEARTLLETNIEAMDELDTKLVNLESVVETLTEDDREPDTYSDDTF